MFNLFALNETTTNGLSPIILYIITGLSIASSVFVIVSKNPIVSVLFLIALFVNIATYLIIIGISFIGFSYLLVYVGAVSILFLFILMLINVRISELVTDNYNSLPLAILIGILFNITYINILPYEHNTENGKDHMSSIYNVANIDLYKVLDNFSVYTNNKLSFVSSHVWDGGISETSHITSIGNVIYTVYPMWLIITSIILLLAMVGSIIITIK